MPNTDGAVHAVCRNTAFTLTARYTDDSPVPEGFDRTIGTFEIGPPVNVPTDGSNAKIKVKVSIFAAMHVLGAWYLLKALMSLSSLHAWHSLPA